MPWEARDVNLANINNGHQLDENSKATNTLFNVLVESLLFVEGKES